MYEKLSTQCLTQSNYHMAQFLLSSIQPTVAERLQWQRSSQVLLACKRWVKALTSNGIFLQISKLLEAHGHYTDGLKGRPPPLCLNAMEPSIASLPQTGVRLGGFLCGDLQ